MDDYKIIMLADDDRLTVKMDSVSVVGTDDYNLLTNIPKIHNTVATGIKSTSASAPALTGTSATITTK